jgi:MarR family transcriptional regulator for hemolysin
MDSVAKSSGIEQGDETHFALTRAIVVAARRWRRIANDRIRHLEQNMARLEILYLVGYSGEELNQSQLAELVSVKGSTMVHMLHALAEEGLIERHQSSSDRRITVNRITNLGREKVRDIMLELRLLRDELYADIDEKDLKITLDTLGKILEKSEKMQQG